MNLTGSVGLDNRIDYLEGLLGKRFFDYQREALVRVEQDSAPHLRRLLFYKTGAGKSITSLSMMGLLDVDEVLVVAPPSTHPEWVELGGVLGIGIEAVSHAKFRQKNFRLSRKKAMIADEFHMFGGHKGQGWKKLDQLAKHLQAPLILCSATPNYNDAERVYCIQHVLDPLSVRGGYLEFLYRECNTRQNPFGQEPLVDEDEPFRRFKTAADYLASLPYVEYLPDDLVWSITDHRYQAAPPDPLTRYGYNERDHKMIASQMEERHTRTFQGLVDESGMIHNHVDAVLADLLRKATTPVLIYANHATVAEALGRTLAAHGANFSVVTGDTSKTEKASRIKAFKAGKHDILVGTASLATGTDGLDKVCDWLIILDDTDDDALRRQLVGRIMPRGVEGGDASIKQVHRLVPN